MSLRQRVTSRLPRPRLLASTKIEDCAICDDPLHASSDTVELEDGEAHRGCVRAGQAIGRMISRRDRVVRRNG